MEVTSKVPPVKRYELLAGVHTDNDPEDVKRVAKARRQVQEGQRRFRENPEDEGARRLVEEGQAVLADHATNGYRQRRVSAENGPVQFDSADDLARFNHAGLPRQKFRLISDSPSTPPEHLQRPDEPLSEFIARLQRIAEGEKPPVAEQPQPPATQPRQPEPQRVQSAGKK